MRTPGVLRYCYVLLYPLCTMFLVNILPTSIEKNLELLIESITLYVFAMCMYIFDIYMQNIFTVYFIHILIDTI